MRTRTKQRILGWLCLSPFITGFGFVFVYPIKTGTGFGWVASVAIVIGIIALIAGAVALLLYGAICLVLAKEEADRGD